MLLGQKYPVVRRRIDLAGDRQPRVVLEDGVPDPGDALLELGKGLLGLLVCLDLLLGRLQLAVPGLGGRDLVDGQIADPLHLDLRRWSGRRV